MRDETSHLPLSDLALIVEDNETEVPSGYGAYLVSEAEISRYAGLENVYVRPEACTAGSFIEISGSHGSRASLMGSSDIPDRTLFLTGLCNSNCIMCPYTEKYRQSSEEVSVETLSRFVDLMNPFSEYLCITGGEPTLLMDGFLMLIKKVNEHFQDTLVHILTNGRAFYYADFLEGYKAVRPYRTLLGIPLHAGSAHLHDSITQTVGSFYETIRGIDNLYMAGEHIEIRIVTSAMNREALPELALFIAKRYPQVYHVCFMGLEMMGNSMINRNRVWCEYDELWPYIQRATDVLIEHGIPVQLYNYPLCVIEEKYHYIYKRSITPSKVEYFEACSLCQRIDDCGGFFRTTKIMPNIHVTPYLR